MRLVNKLVIQAAADNLEDVAAFLEARLDEAECPAKAQRELELAVGEIFLSIAKHAYAPKVGMTEISVEIDDDRLVRISFSDKGLPCDPMQNNDGKLGTDFIKELADDIRYERSGCRNILTLEKRI